MPVKILHGPFRGAIVCMNPRDSLRKIFGIYEHELNPWLNAVLPRVETVIDIGANDGYFTFGCAAAFQRLNKSGEIIAFEPQSEHISQLKDSLQRHQGSRVHIRVFPNFIGRATGPGVLSLNDLYRDLLQGVWDRKEKRTLIKIDVEGAELDVIEGADSWLRSNHYFLIEVHREAYLHLLTERFSTMGQLLMQIGQRPLPVLGREARSKSNWWLVSKLD